MLLIILSFYQILLSRVTFYSSALVNTSVQDLKNFTFIWNKLARMLKKKKSSFTLDKAKWKDNSNAFDFTWTVHDVHMFMYVYLNHVISYIMTFFIHQRCQELVVEKEKYFFFWSKGEYNIEFLRNCALVWSYECVCVVIVKGDIF